MANSVDFKIRFKHEYKMRAHLRQYCGFHLNGITIGHW